MVLVHALRAIDVMLRDITNCDCPIAGKIFLLGGDFSFACRPQVQSNSHCGKLHQKLTIVERIQEV